MNMQTWLMQLPLVALLALCGVQTAHAQTIQYNWADYIQYSRANPAGNGYWCRLSTHATADTVVKTAFAENLPLASFPAQRVASLGQIQLRLACPPPVYAAGSSVPYCPPATHAVVQVANSATQTELLAPYEDTHCAKASRVVAIGATGKKITAFTGCAHKYPTPAPIALSFAPSGDTLGISAPSGQGSKTIVNGNILAAGCALEDPAGGCTLCN